MVTRKHILREIDAFLAETGMTDRAFSLAVAGKDHMFLKRFRNGGGITLATIEKIQAFMAEKRGKRVA